MGTVDQWVSAPARIADPDEGISVDELRLAARNHGMPLEALRYDVTPPGLHYLLTHYDIPALDPADWRLTVSGAVTRPLSLSLADLRIRPRVTRRVTLECAGNGRARLLPRPVSQPWLDEAVGTAEWTGTPLAAVLAEAGVAATAVDVAFTGADHGIERGVEQDYRRGLTLAEAMRDDVLLVDEMNGAPLLPQHGAPVRLIVPGWYGMAQVKWLVGIEVLETEFDGYQNVTSYRVKQEPDEPGEPVTRIMPKALIQPPGVPDFQSRVRVVDHGPVVLTGRAWSGWAPVDAVEISIDDGAGWRPAELGPQPAPYAWRSWRCRWDAVPGRYELRARARDAAGNEQPVGPAWNRQGMANNHAQRVTVVVR
ncbi:sulfite oxidase [Jiangella ureilytica]|uniref:Sulfite oxidase n=1 Tax=Jiangella ureilytica TaxID=2530374 RepID=A0A4R4RV48_9ACTN|nr:sulfite oxidase [Jiangella ureilytica]TDC53536.1 sulfite oxidase [Jiangella ureilytica]